MHSEGFAVDQIHVMEPWADEPSEEAGLAWAPSGLESACAINRLRKLPPSPFRSVGGYLDYAGWSDCQRFMELDRLIQVSAPESLNPPSGADSDALQVCALEWPLTRIEISEFVVPGCTAITLARSASCA